MLYKTTKIVFPGFIFTIHDMAIPGVTRGYRGLKGIQKGYKGLQGLQGVTGDDKGLQGVSMDYKNFFLTRTFPDTFS